MSHANSELDHKKRFLKSYKRNNACIERLEDKLEQLVERIETVRSPNYSGMPRGGTPVTIEELLSDKMDLEKRIERLKKKGTVLKEKVLDEIDTLDDPRYVDILEMFFIDFIPFEDIADITGYTERHVIRLYSEALNVLVKNGTSMS